METARTDHADTIGDRVRAIFRVLARSKRGYTVSQLLERVPPSLGLSEQVLRHHLRLIAGNGYVRRTEGRQGEELWQLTELTGRTAAKAFRRR